MANIVIDIASEFTGKKAFKQAETSTDKLGKSVKSLAKGLIAVYSAQKILSYSKASVKAFAEDEKAAASLGTTLKNLGLAYGSNIGTVNGFVSRLEQQTGVLDDELRPAMDRLLRATGDVAKSQELLNLALDIAAGTGKSVTQVSQSLQKAYLGQTQALGRLGVGLSKAELSTSSFEEIQNRLAVLFAGQATTAANTYAGSLAKLTVASNNAKETIGKGLVDAFVTITNSSSVDDLIGKIDSASESIANFVRESGKFIQITKDLFKFKLFLPSGGLFGDGKGMGNISMTVSSQDTQLADKKAADKIANDAAKQLLALKNKQLETDRKALAAKKLANAIDKANLAIGKGEEIFDMDKIQVAAALVNQTEALGKATTASQVLSIANDVARLKVKQDIMALEDAIASKDQKSIEAATAKLNADLKILGTLENQSIKLVDIKSILASLLPKDLINTANLDLAITKLNAISGMLTDKTKMTDPFVNWKPQVDAAVEALKTLKGEALYIAQMATPISGQYDPRVLTGGQRTDQAGNLVSFNPEQAAASMTSAGTAPTATLAKAADAVVAVTDKITEATTALVTIATSSITSQGQAVTAATFNPEMVGMTSTGVAPAKVEITVNTGIGDPEAIARAVEDVIRSASGRGTRGVFAI